MNSFLIFLLFSASLLMNYFFFCSFLSLSSPLIYCFDEVSYLFGVLFVLLFSLSLYLHQVSNRIFKHLTTSYSFSRSAAQVKRREKKKKEKRWRKTFITIFILHEANNEHQRNEMNGNARTLPAIIMLEYQDKNRKIWYEKSTTNRVYYMKKEKKETLLVTMVMIEKHHLRYTLHLHTHMQHFCSFLFFSHLFSHLIFSRCVWVCVWIKFRFVAYVQCEKLCGVKWHRQRFFFSSLFSPLCVV